MKFLCMVCLVAGFWGISSANRNCPDLIIDSCRCTAERSKVKGFGRQTIRIKVVCNTGELLETLQPSFLPNKTVSLILSNNKISLLKNGSFFGLRSLERLDLKNNLISTIEPGAFRGLSELKRLDLSNNRIGCLSPEMFGDLSNLFKLNLSENIFSTLSQGLFIELVSLKVLHFSTESLFCDCNLKWLLDWARNNAIQIGNETLCVYPSTLHGLELRSLKEQQLKCVGPLELPLFQMIPSYRQVVFLGDRLPFQCTATYIDNTTKVQWYHDGNLIETEEDKGVFVEENIVHDCCLVSSELILSNIDVASSGDWECLVASSRGNISKRVEIVVLETSASYCSAEWITNNKGEFRWPKTLAGINASLPCMQYPFGSGLYHGTLKERRSWRRCDRAGHWAEEDYSECPYSIEVTRVLHSFNQVSINATNALGFAQQLIGCTSGAAHFEDMMDVIFVAQMMEKLMFFVDQIKDLGDYIADIASNMMLVDEHILWMAQNEERACTRIVQCVEHIAELALTINTQVISKVSLNIALEAFVIKPASFTGMTCTAFQKVALNSDRAVIRDVGMQDWEADTQLNFKCNTGNLSSSLVNFPVKDLKTVLSFPPYPGEFLHPVVYACTAVMLLCLFASIITYIVHHSTIRISRKGWHMLLNFCFHTALTFAVFAGGINRIKYPIICQAVGVVLHYSTLSTMLWLGVTARNIYKQVTKKPLQLSDGDQPPQPKQSMLRFYLVSGGIPFLICGITAAININNYGSGEDALYCWMAWEPSLGAFYGPVAFIVLVTCLYFLCTFIQLKRHPERKYELKEMTEEQQRLASTEVGHCHMTASGSLSQATCSMISASMLENEHSFKAQLRSAAFTLFLFLATWTFGALAVSQGHFLDMIFSCLYGAFSVTLGLFILIHHCAKRDDVWHCWWSCCPSRRNTYSTQGNARPKANVNGETQVHSHCVLDSPCPGKAVTGFNHSTSGHCKLTNLQAVQNHVSCLSPITPCCASMHSKHLLDDEPHIHVHSEESFRPSMHIHRCLKSRTKPRHFTQHRTAGDREYAYHIPSSIDGSIHSSHTDSPHSTHDGHTCHRRACCLKGELFPTTSQPESSDASTVVCGCSKMPDDDTVHHAAHLEMHPRRQSSPQNPPNQNGILKGSLHEGLIYSSDSTGNIRTGPWKNETTV
ncbi:adhesion G protein-coupled receptor A2-like isoform X3 [Acipenser ruthenus]|uniref:adhesion G protein-coupled receptor A2-like isoform X3 n=1 Tax=Acipenser ruthenus TaxID=7906 RepID=UPI00145A9A96|nr:adhesion G protein-coupled receptor A2-like isoform X3 [Acipenser ruthenus]